MKIFVLLFVILLLPVLSTADEKTDEDSPETVSVRGGSRNYHLEFNKDGTLKGKEEPSSSMKLPKSKHDHRRDYHAQQKKNRSANKRNLREQKKESKR